jgi:uncharacterized protein YchJ
MPENARTIMTPEAIIARLTNNDYHLPEAALKAAEAMPEIMTPLLLEYLGQVASDPRGMISEDNWYVFYALFLLAKFKEGRTLPILQKMVENTPESLDWILGDGLTEKGSRLFASWAVSSPDALRPFIENQKLDEFSRAEALEAYQCLYYNGIVTLEEVRSYLHVLAYEKLRRGRHSDDSLLWFAWACCCLELGLDEFRPLAKQAYDEVWIDPILSTWDSALRVLSSEKAQEGRRQQLGAFITDTSSELRGWYCFSEAFREKKIQTEEEKAMHASGGMVRETWIPVGTIVNTTPKIKRNQPCPCGSGKKYKKCCGK